MDRHPALLDPSPSLGRGGSTRARVLARRSTSAVSSDASGLHRRWLRAGHQGKRAVWAPRDQMEQGRSTTESRLGRDTDPPSGRSHRPARGRTRRGQHVRRPRVPASADGPSHHLCHAHLRSWVRAGRPAGLDAWYVPLVQRPRIRLGRLRPAVLEVAYGLQLWGDDGTRYMPPAVAGRAVGVLLASSGLASLLDVDLDDWQRWWSALPGVRIDDARAREFLHQTRTDRPPARRRRPVVDPVPSGPLGLSGFGRVQTAAALARFPAHRSALAATAR